MSVGGLQNAKKSKRSGKLPSPMFMRTSSSPPCALHLLLPPQGSRRTARHEFDRCRARASRRLTFLWQYMHSGGFLYSAWPGVVLLCREKLLCPLYDALCSSQWNSLVLDVFPSAWTVFALFPCLSIGAVGVPAFGGAGRRLGPAAGHCMTSAVCGMLKLCASSCCVLDRILVSSRASASAAIHGTGRGPCVASVPGFVSRFLLEGLWFASLDRKSKPSSGSICGTMSA